MAKTILVVDDDPGILFVLVEFLTGLGYVIITAQNGKEGLDKFNKQRFDLVIADVQMPIMNGLDLLKWIKTKSPRTPVLLITGFLPSKAQESTMTAKADGYLMKPFELERLKLTIRKFLV